ncbi:hypothetical protein HMPREF1219_00359 [Corynebacterium pyruviciproducens ATCC BAA-1742]|uniref:Uncharacterized protein n=1 Tax=Corynebacterium pyruviciproducens ATCC BAA-1742 TaxID=1125779 RepID=S2Z2Q9_9CORY|nr:hypothetical protein HMPREF1219_00359 [Corynebacterium pyruviciproducens ATCC BAA-1742]
MPGESFHHCPERARVVSCWAKKISPLVPATRGTARRGNADGEKHGCGYIPLGGQSLGFAAISDLLDEGRDDLVNITNDADIGDLEDGCVLVLVDHHDAL